MKERYTSEAVRMPDIEITTAIWRQNVRRNHADIPEVTVEFLSDLARDVRMIDVRDEDELFGALGHIPAVIHVPLRELAKVPAVLPHDSRLVILSNHGGRAAIATQYLEELGMTRVASLRGGLVEWRKRGYCVVRDRHSYSVSLSDELKVSTELNHEETLPLTVEGVTQHLKDPASVRWMKLATLLMQGRQSCLDGRDDHSVVGAPGGDAGEFLLALSTLETMREEIFQPDEVSALLVEFADLFGQFYMHSDTQAFQYLTTSLSSDDSLQKACFQLNDFSAWNTWLSAPPEEHYETVLSHLCSPQAIGCDHLRLMMERSEEYGIRDELIRSFLRAFHTLRWSGIPDFEWLILSSYHTEKAVLEITVEEPLASWTRIPQISPVVDHAQVFVHHPQVSRFLRRESALFFVKSGFIPDDQFEELVEEMTRFAKRLLDHTLSHIAHTLPKFTVHFDMSGEFVVQQLGHIQ